MYVDTKIHTRAQILPPSLPESVGWPSAGGTSAVAKSDALPGNSHSTGKVVAFLTSS